MPDIDLRVSPSLHSDMLREVDGYSEQTHPYVAPAMELLDDAYRTLGKLHDAREAARQNKSWTEGQQVINVADAAFKQQQRLLAKFDGQLSTLAKQIAHFESELSAPLEANGAVTVATEIRKHVKDLDTDGRHKVLREAVQQGDEKTMSAVLGAPPYLSGLDGSMQATYTRMWHERMSPEKAERLRAIQGAKALVEHRGTLIMNEVQKAIGSTWAKVNELQRRNDAALAALKFQS